RWLSAPSIEGAATPEAVAETVALARRAGAQRIDVLDSADHALERMHDAPTYPGFEFESVRATKFLWGDIVIRRYVAA
ncbi:MAG TPA: hypothetical protein VK461_04070, partial [Acidimicrobiales bacterium]|nr:hypothetical protein [Acidimicrobiales bacterium]